MATAISLEMWVEETRKNLDAFVTKYREAVAADPETWPVEQYGGDWDEQFMMFDGEQL